MKTFGGNIIYTIGHSTHTFQKFLAMLQSFHIQTVADIRSLPGSNKYSQFNKENLQCSLPENGINYFIFKQMRMSVFGKR